jgi:hypothetical protein
VVGQIDERDLEKSTIRRVSLRLVPFLMVCYFFALLDRVNVGFAALQMNKDLGLSPAVFGLGRACSSSRIFLSKYPAIWHSRSTERADGSRAS